MRVASRFASGRSRCAAALAEGRVAIRARSERVARPAALARTLGLDAGHRGGPRETNRREGCALRYRICIQRSSSASLGHITACTRLAMAQLMVRRYSGM